MIYLLDVMENHLMVRWLISLVHIMEYRILIKMYVKDVQEYKKMHGKN